jgi:TonB-linked SusC/RagA family outer membrane protein
MKLWGKSISILAGAALVCAVSAAPAQAQSTGTITGTAVDATSGHTLESAQVYIAALNTGGLTNAQGRFLILNVPAGTHELRLELIGYVASTETVTVTAGQTTTIEFRVNATALRLQELVVTGVAGETPRVKLPFTVDKVDVANAPVPSPSADGIIQGKVAGAKVVRGSGQPGEEASIMLRGPTSLTGSQAPLIIIDGVITDNTMADVDALDISSVEVVKGAAAASLYGSRAANGVIQIITKRGTNLSTDRNRVIARNEYGQNDIEGSIDLAEYHPYKLTADGQDFADAAGNPVGWGPSVQLDGVDLNTTFQTTPFPYTFDALNAFFDPGSYYSNYVATEGKSGGTSYRASFTNMHESGVVQNNDGYTRRNFRVNLDHQIWDNLDLSMSTYYAQTKQEDIGGNPFFSLTFMSPAVDLTETDEDGYYLYSADSLAMEENPLYMTQFYDQWDYNSRIMTSLFVRFRPANWLELEGNYSLDRQDRNQSNITPKGFKTFDNPEGGLGSINKSNSVGNDINASFTASINHAFGDLTTRTKFRYLLEDQHSENFSVTGNDLVVADVPTLAVAQGGKSAGSGIFDVLAEGYFGILALDYQGKYIADALVRRDGSSLFGADQRWQTYYRGSFAWRLAQEDWWPMDAVNEFKLRFSYGTAGDRPGFSAQYETYSVGGGQIRPRNLGNRALKPAFAAEAEYGVDMVLFDKISTGFTYARSEVTDQFLAVPLPSYAGFTSQWQNAGALESKTMEAFLEASVFESQDMSWLARFNFDRTRQEITQLDVPAYRFGPNDNFYMREGEVYGTFYGNRFATSCNELAPGDDCSLFQVNDDGYLVYVGAGNGYQDGISKSLWGTSENGYDWGMPIVAQECDAAGECEDFLPIGNTLPDFTLSLSNTFRYKNLQVHALLDWDVGADIYNGTAQWAYRELKHGIVDQVGKPEGQMKPLGYYPALYNVNEISSHFVEDGTYLKLRELSLRYTMDEDQLGGALGLTRASLSLIGRNVLTFTDFTGYDPEVGSGTGGADAIGRIDNYQYPNYRTFSASVELVF